MADSSYREIYKHEQIKTEYGLPVRYIVYEEDNAFVSRHWHDDMEIVYLLAGSMVVETGDCRRILQADDYIIINSRDIHSTRCIGHARILLLQFPINFLRANIPDYDTIRFEGYEQPFLSPEQNEMRKLLLYAADLYTKKDQEGFRLAFLGNLYTILYTLAGFQTDPLATGTFKDRKKSVTVIHHYLLCGYPLYTADFCRTGSRPDPCRRGIFLPVFQKIHGTDLFRICHAGQDPACRS